MERKIMSLGRSSLVISLPKYWLRMNELKKGDVVSFAVQRDRSLVVFPIGEQKREPKEITLEINQDERESLTVRKIVGCYLNGYSGIKVVSKSVFSVSQSKAIRNIVRMLFMRIMESDAKSMYIQTLIDESRASLDLAIHRMHLISNSMCRDAMNSLKSQDATLAKAIYSLDDDVDHFCFFLTRLLRDAARDSVLANKLGLEPLDCLDHQTLVYRVEYAADQAANIAGHVIMLSGSKQKIPQNLIIRTFEAGGKAVDLYDKAVSAFFSRDVAIADEILEKQKDIEALDRKIASEAFLSKEMNPLLICAICSLRDSIKRIAACAADIAAIAINRAYKIAASPS
ncbi:phosphate uptake regulator PhoU [Candidatus Bathyarchaeota archaeon]|nr:phosphate uptake regulator PhoU [Candidatus Bathyarchaeota archaeon]